MSLIVDMMEGSQMPRGTRHALNGTLHCTPRGFELHVDDGGIWALDVRSWRRARKLVGKRVKVVGTRAEFNLINVQRMEDMDEQEVTPAWWWLTLGRRR